MFAFDKPEAIREINSRNGDHWTVVPGSFTVHGPVLRFKTQDGRSVQIHVAETASLVSEDQ